VRSQESPRPPGETEDGERFLGRAGLRRERREEYGGAAVRGEAVKRDSEHGALDGACLAPPVTMGPDPARGPEAM